MRMTQRPTPRGKTRRQGARPKKTHPHPSWGRQVKGGHPRTGGNAFLPDIGPRGSLYVITLDLMEEGHSELGTSYPLLPDDDPVVESKSNLANSTESVPGRGANEQTPRLTTLTEGALQAHDPTHGAATCAKGSDGSGSMTTILPEPP